MLCVRPQPILSPASAQQRSTSAQQRSTSVQFLLGLHSSGVQSGFISAPLNPPSDHPQPSFMEPFSAQPQPTVPHPKQKVISASLMLTQLTDFFFFYAELIPHGPSTFMIQYYSVCNSTSSRPLCTSLSSIPLYLPLPHLPLLYLPLHLPYIYHPNYSISTIPSTPLYLPQNLPVIFPYLPL